ncbi:MAG: DUF982 domain-containing protein [Rhizobiaceae bacterium]|nr:DUF982 domain-containing protein [Rhizobiaceae bacterium]
MTKHLWDRPVTVATGTIGKYLTINNTERATLFLIRDWPVKPCDKAHAFAKRQLLEANHGRIAPAAARDAFLAAAVSAGIIVRD